MNLQRRATSTLYSNLLESSESVSRLHNEPRLKIFGDHICRALVERSNYNAIKANLEELSELLPQSLGFAATASVLIHGKEALYIGLKGSAESIAAIRDEQDTVLRMFNTSFNELLDESTQRTGKLIVAKFSHRETEPASRLADELQEIIENEPLRIELGPPIVHVSKS